MKVVHIGEVSIFGIRWRDCPRFKQARSCCVDHVPTWQRSLYLRQPQTGWAAAIPLKVCRRAMDEGGYSGKAFLCTLPP